MVNVTTTCTVEQALYIRSKIHPVADIGIHPKGMYYGLNMLDIADPEKPESRVLQLLSTWCISDEDAETSPEKRLQKFEEMANDCAEPHHSAAEWLPDTIKIHHDLLRHWIPKPWNDRLTLGGDAAHAMTFHKLHAVPFN